MSKESLKTTLFELQDGCDAITDEPLSKEPKENDTHRLEPKAQNGTYDNLDNVQLLTPVTHMIEHGTFRTRDEAMNFLKSAYDDRLQTLKVRNKINNQLLAYQRRTDHVNPGTVEFLTRMKEPAEIRLAQYTELVDAAIRAQNDLLVDCALKVPGLGPITVAALTIYVDLRKAATPSALWRYVGLDKPSHERFEKGRASGGNRTLRTQLWNMAVVMVKLGQPKQCVDSYRAVYDRIKERLAVSEKPVKTRNTDGNLVVLPWKDTKACHRAGAGLRGIMKHLLADYWFVGRTINGLPTVPLYAESMLGHTHIINPRDRGWEF